MKRMMLIVVLIAVSTASGAQDRDIGRSARERLIGAWRLVRLEEPGPDGRIHDADCSGMFVFTRDGRASVQVMYRSTQTAGGPVQYAQGDYEASFGRYEVDEAGGTFTYHVEGALVRSLVGKDLKRVFELKEQRLTVKSSDPKERWRVTWEHY
jgi:hypothetical protein